MTLYVRLQAKDVDSGVRHMMDHVVSFAACDHHACNEVICDFMRVRSKL